MVLSFAIEDLGLNPLDRVERLAERRAWTLDRTSAEEVIMGVTGGWCDLSISMNWREDLESLLVSAAYELRVPGKRQDEIAKLLAMINAQLVHGHFDFWLVEGTIIYRHALLLAGGAEANDEQCEAMIRIAVDTCQRYYPAVQFVIWAGQKAEEALDNALLDTRGEA
jgi:hypothetical protein